MALDISSRHHRPSLRTLSSRLLFLTIYTVSPATYITAQSTTSFNPQPQFFGNNNIWIALIVICAVTLLASLANIGYQHMKVPAFSKLKTIQELKENANPQKHKRRTRGSRSQAAQCDDEQSKYGIDTNNIYDQNVDDTSNYITNPTPTHGRTLSNSQTATTHPMLDEDTLNEIQHFRYMSLVYSFLPLLFLCSKPWDTTILQQYIELNDWYGRIAELPFLVYYITGITVALLLYGFAASYLAVRYNTMWFFYIYNIIHIAAFGAAGYYGFQLCDQSICRVYSVTQNRNNYPSMGGGMILTFIILLICSASLLFQLSNSMKAVGVNSVRVVSEVRVKLDRENAK